MMLSSRSLILVLFFLTSLQGVSLAQYTEIYYTRDSRASLQAAEYFIGRKEWNLALKQLRHTTKLKGKMAVTYRLLGKVELELGHYAEAARSYARSFDLDPNVSRAAYFEHGEALLAAGDADGAMASFLRYQSMANERYANKTKETATEQLFDELLDRRLVSCRLWQTVDSSSITSWPEQIPGQVNTVHDEYMPSADHSGTHLIFTRQEPDGNENIYRAQRSSPEKWGYPRPLSEAVHTPLNEGMAKYAPLSRFFLFAGCRRSDTEGSCDIYKSFLEENEELDIYPLPGNLNSTYWDSQPSISCDGRSIYFSSLRPGGYGGADIWVSHQLQDGTWGSPKNLGPEVNTQGDEEGPFIANDGVTLYFASDGKPGFGYHDLFVSRLEYGQWTEAINLGFPINSAARELGIHLFADADMMLFASSRDGTMDIFQAHVPESLRPAPMCQIEGEIFDLTDGKPLSGAHILMKSGEDGMMLYSDEYGQFSACVVGGKGYSFQVDYPGYTYFVDAAYFSSDTVHRIEIALEKERLIRSEPKPERTVQVFFPMNSTEPDPAGKTRLKDLVQLLRQNPELIVEITGYADSTGSSEYNRELSRARADSIASFLQQHGVDSGVIVRISGQGMLDQSDASRRADIVLKGE